MHRARWYKNRAKCLFKSLAFYFILNHIWIVIEPKLMTYDLTILRTKRAQRKKTKFWFVCTTSNASWHMITYLCSKMSHFWKVWMFLPLVVDFTDIAMNSIFLVIKFAFCLSKSPGSFIIYVVALIELDQGIEARLTCVIIFELSRTGFWPRISKGIHTIAASKYSLHHYCVR